MIYIGTLITIRQIILFFAVLYLMARGLNKLNYWYYMKSYKKDFLKNLNNFKEKNSNEVIINMIAEVHTLEFNYHIYMGYINYMRDSYKHKVYNNIVNFAKTQGCEFLKVERDGLDNTDYHVTFLV